MISLIYCLMGMLVWYLVHQLEIKQAKLYRNMMELEATREKAAGGRAPGRGRPSGERSGARDPQPGSDDCQFSRYRSLSFGGSVGARGDVRHCRSRGKETRNPDQRFSTYARPSLPQRSTFPIAEILNHVVNMTRMRAAERSIEVVCQPWDELMAEIDTSQVEGALVNLSFNAIDATPDGGRITFRCRHR